MENRNSYKSGALWFGFALGITSGVALSFLFGTKKGRKILNQIIELAEDVENEGVFIFREITDKIKTSTEDKPKENIKTLIDKIRSVTQEKRQTKQFIKSA